MMLGAVRREKFAPKHELFDERRMVEIRDLRQGAERLCDYKICYLSGSYRPDNVGNAHRIGRIYGNSIERLDGSKAHLDASEGPDESHIPGRR